MSISSEITGRIGIHKFALFVLQEFGWIEREQFVSDWGIDHTIEIVQEGIPTGLLYSVQVKSGTSYFKEASDSKIVFRTDSERVVNYWLNHSLPVILVLYNPDSDEMYWSFANSKTVLNTGKGYKIEIPKTNLLTNRSKEEIVKYYFDVNQISILRTRDTSHALSRRISKSVLIAKKTSDTVIEAIAPDLVEQFKKSDYYRNKMVSDIHGGNMADSIWIYFYKTQEQYNYGLPYCIVAWNDPESVCKTPITGFNKEIRDGIWINYHGELIPDELIRERSISKGQFLSVVDNFIGIFVDRFNSIKAVYERVDDVNQVMQQIIMFDEQFHSMLPEKYRMGYPPNECSDLAQIVSELDALFYNLLIVAKATDRTIQNKNALFKTYFSQISEKIPEAQYERKKVT